MVDVNQKAATKFGQPMSDNLHTQSGNKVWQFTVHSTTWRPPTDVYETASKIIIRVEIAGMRDSIFNVRIDQNHLSISGVRSDSQEPKGFHQMEISYGEFLGEIKLPVFVDIDHVHAEYDDGFLIITLLKKLPTKVTITE